MEARTASAVGMAARQRLEDPDSPKRASRRRVNIVLDMAFSTSMSGKEK
jgi:flagellar motor protein MotB